MFSKLTQVVVLDELIKFPFRKDLILWPVLLLLLQNHSYKQLYFCFMLENNYTA